MGLTGNGQTFLEKKEGLPRREIYQKLLKLAGEYVESGESQEKYTLEYYSKQKKLPIKFLNFLKLKNYRYGIEIPYFNIHGDEICKRRRYAGRNLTGLAARELGFTSFYLDRKSRGAEDKWTISKLKEIIDFVEEIK